MFASLMRLELAETFGKDHLIVVEQIVFECCYVAVESRRETKKPHAEREDLIQSFDGQEPAYAAIGE